MSLRVSASNCDLSSLLLSSKHLPSLVRNFLEAKFSTRGKWRKWRSCNTIEAGVCTWLAKDSTLLISSNFAKSEGICKRDMSAASRKHQAILKLVTSHSKSTMSCSVKESQEPTSWSDACIAWYTSDLFQLTKGPSLLKVLCPSAMSKPSRFGVWNFLCEPKFSTSSSIKCKARLNDLVVTDILISCLRKGILSICHKVVNDLMTFPSCACWITKRDSEAPNLHSECGNPTTKKLLVPISTENKTAAPRKGSKKLIQRRDLLHAAFSPRDVVRIDAQKIANVQSKELAITLHFCTQPLNVQTAPNEGQDSASKTVCFHLLEATAKTEVAKLVNVVPNWIKLFQATRSVLHTNHIRSVIDFPSLNQIDQSQKAFIASHSDCPKSSIREFILAFRSTSINICCRGSHSCSRLPMPILLAMASMSLSLAARFHHSRLGLLNTLSPLHLFNQLRLSLQAQQRLRMYICVPGRVFQPDQVKAKTSGSCPRDTTLSNAFWVMVTFLVAMTLRQAPNFFK